MHLLLFQKAFISDCRRCYENNFKSKQELNELCNGINAIWYCTEMAGTPQGGALSANIALHGLETLN